MADIKLHKIALGAWAWGNSGGADMPRQVAGWLAENA